MDADFDALWARHSQRLRTSQKTVQTWPEKDPLTLLEEIERAEAQAQVDRGLARFLPDDTNVWRHTAWGGIRHVLAFPRKIVMALSQLAGITRRKVGKHSLPTLIGGVTSEQADDDNPYSPPFAGK